MKIYNEVITQFNDITGHWETLYEDYEDYNGPVALAQGLPPQATVISDQDTVSDTIKTTAGYFTNGDGTLSGINVHTGSLSDSNEKYYFNVTQVHPDSSSAEVQFAVTYGHIAGSGSNQYGDSSTNNSNIIGSTQAIYKQLANLLLEESEASGGFKISSHQGGTGALGAGVRDEYIYVFVGKRAKFKDRINKKVWTLVLSGSSAKAGGVDPLYLTDDSNIKAAQSSPGGPRYNIISGALGAAATAHSTGYLSKTYGWFYPEMGMMVFSGAELSASIPGQSNNGDGESHSTASFAVNKTVGVLSSSGFAPNLDATGNSFNALRFINCMRNVGSGNTLRLRSEEDATQENYFCRVSAVDYNFSNNPSFVSGSKNKIRQKTMWGNPSTFITGVGLYNSAGQLLATAKLSSPLKKNYASEATIKVKLTY